MLLEENRKDYFHVLGQRLLKRTKNSINKKGIIVTIKNFTLSKDIKRGKSHKARENICNANIQQKANIYIIF